LPCDTGARPLEQSGLFGDERFGPVTRFLTARVRSPKNCCANGGAFGTSDRGQRASGREVVGSEIERGISDQKVRRYLASAEYDLHNDRGHVRDFGIDKWDALRVHGSSRQ